MKNPAPTQAFPAKLAPTQFLFPTSAVVGALDLKKTLPG